MFSWKLWVLWSQFLRQNDRKNILYNPSFDGSVHRVKFHNFISSFIKELCYFGSICGGISGGFGPIRARDMNQQWKKIGRCLRKLTFFLQKIIFYRIFPCARAQGENPKLMLKLDEHLLLKWVSCETCCLILLLSVSLCSFFRLCIVVTFHDNGFL